MIEYLELAEKTEHPRNKIIVESMAARMKLQISHVIWLEDTSKSPFDKVSINLFV